MDTHMIITVISPAKPSIVALLTQIIHEHNGRICDSHMASFGEDYGWQLQVAGKWDSLAKLETDLPDIAEKNDLMIQFKRTQPSQPRKALTRYSAQIISSDKLGIMANFFQFLTREKLGLEECYTDHYHPYGLDTPMFSLNAIVHIPIDESIAQLRERFTVFCDEQNFDGALEPIKG